MLIDTHCHIHEASYPLDADEVRQRATAQEVSKLICVGTDEKSSLEAVEYVATRENCWASVGLHPHDAKDGLKSLAGVKTLLEAHSSSKIVAIGECGLDYFYNNSPKQQQVEMLHAQIKLALQYDLPLIFHVREAFSDFWPILEQYKGVRGVLHSFTDTEENMQKAIEKGLYIGVNGISTFTKIETQQKMYTSIPVNRLLLETDAPFLTPVPMRGIVNEPAFITHVAQFHANLRALSLKELSAATTENATRLFNLK